MVDWPWNNIINILSTFHNMINSLVSRKNCHLKVWMWLVSLSNLTKDPWSFTIVVREFENSSFAASASLFGTCLQEISFLRIFSNISVKNLEDSTMKFGDKHSRHLANKDRSGQNFSLLGWKGLPKTPNLLFKLKNLPVYNLLTIN